MKHILVIDDEPQVLRLIGLLLSKGGYRVSAAADGRQGLDLLGRGDVDLVLTDIFMPDMDGLEVLMHCRQHHGDVPVAVLSGGGRQADSLDGLAVAREMGADAVLAASIFHFAEHSLGEAKRYMAERGVEVRL